MARKPRIEYPGAIYHVMSRGNRQGAIYLDDKDYSLFLETLGETCAKTGWRVHAYVLMGNHYHLLLETPEANLVAGMKWLQGTYTQRFNSRHKVWGHLLQGRYKALPVDGASGEYFSTLGGYIHLNPARARLFDPKQGQLSDYRWSSYPKYLSHSQRPPWLKVERLLGAAGFTDERSEREQFRRMMQKRVVEIAHSANPAEADAHWAKIRRGWYFGSESFRDQLVEKLDEQVGKTARRDSLSGESARQHDEAEARQLLFDGLKKFGVSCDSLDDMRKNALEKQVIAWLLRSRTIVSNQWITEHLKCGHPCNVSAFVGRVKRAKDGPLAQMRETLISKD